ncbi:hypothetical protein [Clostridium cellulovorans]|uniref:Uncharacterized protein n=1 Tax=Clostridium cellulovorans (strain ATCC 35296 / DSM 3052 / OCM 3 / 743B) TaxID=573061 RepID=D9SSX9_CLOC7|nr:hypothetical protein [Clostridium cellulovorans]ADL52641.1 hypothetical protein Clocel_2948 [Clostridium cellulovorans 743B]
MKDLSIWVSIATLVTALTGLLNILVLRKQTRDSLKPEVIILENKISLFWNYSVFGKILTPGYCVKSENLKETEVFIDKDQTVYETHVISLCIANIGKESAKNIKITWDIDYLELINVLKTFDKENQFKVEFGDENLDTIFFYDEEQKFGLGIPLNEISSVQYILPVAKNSNLVEVEMPTCFRYIYAAMLKLESENHEMTYMLDNLKVNVTIEYKDISSNRYKSKFIIKFERIVSYKAEGVQDKLKRAMDLKMKVTKTW